MKLIKATLFWVIVTILTGCSIVYTTQPIGEQARPIETEKWEGTWTNGEEVITIYVLDETKGLLQVAWLETDEDQLTLESYKVYLLESGDWLFASIQDEDNPKWYDWGRIKIEGRQLIFWLPNPEKFKVLVEKGLLPGRIHDDDVVLGDLTAQHLQLITSEKEGVLFEWESPVILIKLGK